uniref:Junctional sarcoplasmic reticulum protein 1 n=1 Tax=Bos mutus grunniens TaxID=30521 RepID=A0A8B9W5Q1_BOSMU
MEQAIFYLHPHSLCPWPGPAWRLWPDSGPAAAQPSPWQPGPWRSWMEAWAAVKWMRTSLYWLTLVPAGLRRTVCEDSQERVTEGSPTGSVDTKPKKMEKEPVSKVTSGAGKEKLKAGATPRSPARKKAQTASPPQPPPPPALSDELPWGDLTLNKCLVLASLVALLGSAFQLCREAVARDVEAPAPVPESWASSSLSPKGPASTLPKPEAWAPSVRQPEPLGLEERVQIPRSEKAAEKDEWESEEAANGEHVPLAGRGPKEKLKKEKPRKERPGKEKPQKEERPRKEKPRKEEKPRGAREPQGALPRRWEAREGGHRPWGRDSGAPEDRKRQN